MRKTIKVKTLIDVTYITCDLCGSEVSTNCYINKCNGCGCDFCDKHIGDYFDDGYFCEKCIKIERMSDNEVDKIYLKKECIYKMIKYLNLRKKSEVIK